MNNTDMKVCPYCGEDIKAHALKCKHCKTILKEELAMDSFKDKKTTEKGKSNKRPFLYATIILTAIALLIIGLVYMFNTNKNDLLTEGEIVDAFIAAGLPIGEVIIYTEETCPNNLLGRPGQYIGKASWADSRVEQYGEEPLGGTVEVFANEKDLNNRKGYLEAIMTVPLFAQYMYVYRNTLVRIEKDLTPAQAEEYNMVLNSISNSGGAKATVIENKDHEQEITSDRGTTIQEHEPGQPVSAEIIRELLDVWQDRDKIYAHYSLEIINTGANTIEIDWPVTVSLVGDGNSILYSESTEVFPSVLAPGESAYAGGGTQLEHINNIEEVKDMEINYSYSETFRKHSNLQLENLNFFIEQSRIKVTGRVFNNLDRAVDSTRIKIALFDVDDNLLGTIFGYTSGKIPPGGNLGFDTSSYYLNINTIKGLIFRIEGRAYNMD